MIYFQEQRLGWPGMVALRRADRIDVGRFSKGLVAGSARNQSELLAESVLSELEYYPMFHVHSIP